jgi:uncharacterized protein YjbJ (UPF0337 family)
MGLLDRLLGRGKKAAGDMMGRSTMHHEGAAEEHDAAAEQHEHMAQEQHEQAAEGNTERENM